MPADTENNAVSGDTENNAATENAVSDADALSLATLKADLNRSGNFPSDNEYLSFLLSASREWLDAQGVHDDGSAMYRQILVSRAAYVYRKRVTGAAEPQFLRRMVHDYKLSHMEADA